MNEEQAAQIASIAALQGFEIFPRRSDAKLAGGMFATLQKSGSQAPNSLKLSAAVASVFAPSHVVVMLNRAGREIAFVPATTGVRVRDAANAPSPKGKQYTTKCLGIRAVVAELNLQPGIRLPARMADGVLIVDYSSAVAPEAHA